MYRVLRPFCLRGRPQLPLVHKDVYIVVRSKYHYAVIPATDVNESSVVAANRWYDSSSCFRMPVEARASTKRKIS